MTFMKSKILVAMLILWGTSVGAQSITASDLEKLCSSSESSDRSACMLITKVYMDGFLEGVSKGVIDTYRYDPLVFALVKDMKMKDSLPRVTKVVDAASCIRKVSVEAMSSAYLEFVKSHPNLRTEHYRKSMTLAIVAKYCNK
jgi:hypothetical protein